MKNRSTSVWKFEGTEYGMNPEEHERRRRIWQLLTQDDRSLREIIEVVADDFDTAPKTVEEDLETIEEWLPELDLLREVPSISLLAKLRQNRQQLHQMAEQAHEQDDLVQERQIRSEINRSLNIERQLSDSELQITRTRSDDELEEFMRDLS